MTAKPLIFLDVDGVLADFVGPVLRLFDREDLLDAWPRGEYSIEKALGLTTAELWKEIDEHGRDFWADLPAYPWALDLYGRCHQYGTVYLLTAAHSSPACHWGKVRWFEKNLGADYGPSIMTRHKHLLAAHRRILIDDFDQNINEWTENTSADGILFPRPWNSRHATPDPLATTLADLDRLTAQ